MRRCDDRFDCSWHLLLAAKNARLERQYPCHQHRGRFLEHSRIFYFENAGQPKVFLSSADWMPRNFYRRIELAFPVENPALRDQIINEVLPSFLHDRVKA